MKVIIKEEEKLIGLESLRCGLNCGRIEGGGEKKRKRMMNRTNSENVSV
jgi:hypothetical protein